MTAMCILTPRGRLFLTMWLCDRCYPRKLAKPFYIHTHANKPQKGLIEAPGTTVCNALMRFVVWRWCVALCIMCGRNGTNSFILCFFFRMKKENKLMQLFRDDSSVLWFSPSHIHGCLNLTAKLISLMVHNAYWNVEDATDISGYVRVGGLTFIG